jgi:hypothetical protein
LKVWGGGFLIVLIGFALAWFTNKAKTILRHGT